MGILIKGMDEIPEDGAVLVVKHDNGKAYIKHACTYGYSMELVKLPAVQPDHNANVSKKVADKDCISKRAAIDIFDDCNVSVENGELEAYSRDKKRLCGLPPVQPKIIYCKDCIWYELPSHRITENCVRWMKSNGILLPIKPNDYCSYAERRTDG